MSDHLESMQRQIDWLAAQLEELRTEEYNMAQNHGWISGAWQKDPLADGYSGDKSQQVLNTSATAGSNTLTGDTVPAGEIWHVQAIAAQDLNSAPTSILLAVTVNAMPLILNTVTAPGANIWASWTGRITLSPGDSVFAILNGCTLNDDIYLRYHGVRVDIDQ